MQVQLSKPLFSIHTSRPCPLTLFENLLSYEFEDFHVRISEQKEGGSVGEDVIRP
jgi:hypothetical protein